ncbi:adenosylcobinamide-phosphate synthase, partial [Paenibacillus sp. 28ISP30-2]|nr:adenosylcobinamide-phosphate synthase [Paenibacillus sp. 28ISP30-2]
LGGYNVYHGVRSFRAYMGELVRPMEPDDIRHTIRLMFAVSSMFAGLCLFVSAGCYALGWIQ